MPRCVESNSAQFCVLGSRQKRQIGKIQKDAILPSLFRFGGPRKSHAASDYCGTLYAAISGWLNCAQLCRIASYTILDNFCQVGVHTCVGGFLPEFEVWSVLFWDLSTIGCFWLHPFYTFGREYCFFLPSGMLQHVQQALCLPCLPWLSLPMPQKQHISSSAPAQPVASHDA